MMRALVLILALSTAAQADTVVATRTIRAQEIIQPSDLALKPIVVSGGVSEAAQLVGLEARVALYAGRPVRLSDVSAPALVERNEIIPLVYSQGGLSIATEGRALGRAAEGERIRVMNLSSRSSVFAVIGSDGAAYVGRN